METEEVRQPRKKQPIQIVEPVVIGRGGLGTLREFKQKLNQLINRRRKRRLSAAMLVGSVAFASAASQPRSGLASWYGEEHRGKFMANGRPFDPDKFTAASWDYPLDTRVRVFHGQRSVAVEITDRGPAKRLVKQGRVIDLSYAAFQALSDPSLGLIQVELKRE
jgi:rare lipoprotein A